MEKILNGSFVRTLDKLDLGRWSRDYGGEEMARKEVNLAEDGVGGERNGTEQRA